MGQHKTTVFIHYLCVCIAPVVVRQYTTTHSGYQSLPRELDVFARFHERWIPIKVRYRIKLCFMVRKGPSLMHIDGELHAVLK